MIFAVKCTYIQKQPRRGVPRKGVQKICSKFTGKHHTSAWVFSCKFTAYFQNTLFIEHLWVAVCVCSDHFKDDCFDSSWMLQSTPTYSNTDLFKDAFFQKQCPRNFSINQYKNDIFVRDSSQKGGLFFLFIRKLLLEHKLNFKNR